MGDVATAADRLVAALARHGLRADRFDQPAGYGVNVWARTGRTPRLTVEIDQEGYRWPSVPGAATIRNRMHLSAPAVEVAAAVASRARG